jgi:hypothetical protein
MSVEMVNDVSSLIFKLIARQYESEYSTGIVFAGYGREERLPVLQECVCDGIDDGLFRFWDKESINLGDDKAPSSILRPFGQADVAFLFVEGIAIRHVEFIKTAISRVLEDKSDTLVKDYIASADERIVETARQGKDNSLIVDKLMDGFGEYRRGGLVRPLMRVVTSLPKEEMATLAESIVELTSLRRKMESHMDTVGGPNRRRRHIKGDGFIWINRKHYFDIELNNDFLYRKESNMRGGGNAKKSGASANARIRRRSGRSVA